MVDNSVMLPLCVYSHSDFFDILQIQVDYIKKLNIPCDIYLFINTPFNMNGGKRTKYKSFKRRYGTRKKMNGGNNIKTILYDDKLRYHERLLSCIKQLNSPYFILTRDTDVILEIDMDAIYKIVKAMNTNNIDAIKLTNDINAKPEIYIKDTLYISELTDADKLFAYSVLPRIWRKESALKIYSLFPDKNYRTSENANVQKYTNTAQKVYTLYDINMIKAVYACTKHYKIINITHSGGQIAQYDKRSNTDPIIISEYAKIKDKYFKNTKRTFHP